MTQKSDFLLGTSFDVLFGLLEPRHWMAFPGVEFMSSGSHMTPVCIWRDVQQHKRAILQFAYAAKALDSEPASDVCIMTVLTNT